jgi:FdhE protein
MERPLASPEEIAVQAGSSIPYLFVPDRAEVFRRRADRLLALAPSHAMGDYLRFVAKVATAQQRLLDDMPPVALPSPEEIATCNEHRMPPLNAGSHRRDPLWRDGLRRMLRALTEEAEGRQREVLVRLEQERDDFYEAQASKLLAGITLGLDIAAAPLLGAGLQVYFTHLSAALGEAAIQRTDVASLCPCCASRPTASVVRVGGAHGGYRFLHCSLCSVEWHMVRVKCANCESTKGIAYAALEREGGGTAKPVVSAETCEECGSYLKLCSMERDVNVDPVADDLATVALDFLVTDTGKSGCGVNLMLIHGDPEDE